MHLQKVTLAGDGEQALVDQSLNVYLSRVDLSILVKQPDGLSGAAYLKAHIPHPAPGYLPTVSSPACIDCLIR